MLKWARKSSLSLRSVKTAMANALQPMNIASQGVAVRHYRHDLSERNGDLLAAFPVEESDQIMLVTNGGTLIRCPIDDIRIAGRNTQGDDFQNR